MPTLSRGTLPVLAALLLPGGAAAQHCLINKVTAHDSAAGDQFGSAVAMSGDTLVVGAPFADRGRRNSGRVQVLEHVSNAVALRFGERL